MKTKLFFVLLIALASKSCFAQGFVNLGFEQGTLVSDGSGSYVASNAVPGWSAYINGVKQNSMQYNFLALSSAAVSLQGTNSPVSGAPLQGNYSLFLQSGNFDSQNGTNAAIGQIGQIPLSAQSLLFWGTSLDGWKFTFAGQLLIFSAMSSTINYTVYGADVSAYAGQTGELLFSTIQYPNPFGPFPPAFQASGLLDNIQFSNTAVPEPTTFGLAALGGLLLAWHRGKKF